MTEHGLSGPPDALRIGSPMRESRVHPPDRSLVRWSVARDDSRDAAHGCRVTRLTWSREARRFAAPVADRLEVHERCRDARISSRIQSGARRLHLRYGAERRAGT